jgi:hypothetical protein
MSMTHTIAGAGVVGLLISAAIGVVLPKPTPITIHSLTIDDGGVVTQDRTVITQSDAFFATWSAAVMDMASGAPVEGCEGSGTFPYEPGRVAARMPLPRWVGSATCTFDALPPGQYQLRAAWYWGGSQTAAVSPVFTVGG